MGCSTDLKVGVQPGSYQCKPQYHDGNTAVEREDVSTIPCLTYPSQSNLPSHLDQLIQDNNEQDINKQKTMSTLRALRN